MFTVRDERFIDPLFEIISSGRLVLNLSSSTLASGRLMNGCELRNLTNRHAGITVPYLGSRLGINLLRSLETDAVQLLLLDSLDRVCSAVSAVDYSLLESSALKPAAFLKTFAVELDFGRLDFRFLGHGHYGSAFELDLCGLTFAFKCFFRRTAAEIFPSGPWTETAMALWASEKNIRDMPHLILANPEAGWMLMEYVSDDSEPKDGPSSSELGLTYLDENRAVNHVETLSGTKIRLDYGHLGCSQRLNLYPPSGLTSLIKTRKSEIHCQDFLNVFKSEPESRVWCYEFLARLPESDRIKFIEETISDSDIRYFPIPDFFESKVLPAAAAGEILKICYNHPDPLVKGRAFCNPDWLKGSERQIWQERWDNDPAFSAFRVARGNLREFSAILSRCFDL